MFAPLKTYRRWHRKINVNHKRHAVAAALAASVVTPLVQARGHRVENVPELPLVIDSLNVQETKALLTSLEKFGVHDDLERTRQSKKIRQGKGKMRNSRYVMRKGPLIIYGNENLNVKRSARNLPGIDTCHVDRLNLLQLAPGGHLGRFIIWTKDAYAKLNKIFGNYRRKDIEKEGYVLNRSVITCADLARLINSDQVQSKLRDVKTSEKLHTKQKKNPLKNAALMKRLNPFDAQRKDLEKKAREERQSKRAATLKARRKTSGARRAAHTKLTGALLDSFKEADDAWAADRALDGEIESSDEEEDDE